MTDRELMSIAKKASMNAYVPYSRFPVGAALECDDGTVFSGCNVENAALGSTICAERTACCKAVSIPLDKAHAKLLLQRRDGPADRGMADIQPPRRAREAPFIRDGGEHAQLLQLHQ